MVLKVTILAILGLCGVSAAKLSHQKFAWYTFNESKNKNRCNVDEQCDGQRTCTQWGHCGGIARPIKNADYKYDEAPTESKCSGQYAKFYCDGRRTCSEFGWCEGIAR